MNPNPADNAHLGQQLLVHQQYSRTLLEQIEVLRQEVEVHNQAAARIEVQLAAAPQPQETPVPISPAHPPVTRIPASARTSLFSRTSQERLLGPGGAASASRGAKVGSPGGRRRRWQEE